MKIALPLGLALGLAFASTALAADEAPLKKTDWSFNGPFGMFDRAQLQRGFQIYKEVCSACHSMNRVAFHALSDEGGPGFSEAQVKALAAAVQVPKEPDTKTGATHNDAGERIKRPGIPADPMVGPAYENEIAARAVYNGALPPDLSLMAKAREGGPDYIHSVLTGFVPAPAGFKVLENKYYNEYFPGHNISMPPPLKANIVTYSDGTPATLDQEAQDVSAFLMWAAEPKLEQRHHIGVAVMIFLLGLSTLLFLAYRKMWHGQH